MAPCFGPYVGRVGKQVILEELAPMEGRSGKRKKVGQRDQLQSGTTKPYGC
jgi:hypothetical protein